jgi:ABC-type transport system involved in multi-copper enzyme maturation permease subunit
MLATLIKKEIVSHILSLRFAAAFAVILLAVFGGFYFSAADYVRRRAEFDAQSIANRIHLDEMLSDDVHYGREAPYTAMRRLLNWEGCYHAVQPPPLAAIVKGQTQGFPVGAQTAARMLWIIDYRWPRYAMGELHHSPDLAYVTGTLLSLLALLLTFDSICGEKESGTLRILLSNAVPRYAIVTAKWIASIAVMVTPFLVGSVAGLTYAWGSGGLILSEETVVRICLLLAAAVLYLSVFLALGLFVSTVARRSATSLFACLFAWVFWCVVTPNVATMIAKFAAPVPSLKKVAAEKATIDRSLAILEERVSQQSGDRLQGTGKVRIYDESIVAKRKWDHYLLLRSRRQREWARWLGRLSPTGCWSYAAAALAQTGNDSSDRLEASIQRVAEDLYDLKYKLDEEWSATGDFPQIKAKQVPTIATPYPPLDHSIEDALPDFVILIGFAAIFFLASFAKFLRYDVR